MLQDISWIYIFRFHFIIQNFDKTIDKINNIIVLKIISINSFILAGKLQLVLGKRIV